MYVTFEERRMKKEAMDLETRRFKRRVYMRDYRKRDYVKKRTHDYYINRLIRESEEDNIKIKKLLGGIRTRNEKIRAL
jgi:hypothetical protein|tara:strand:- start:269 stop:502 length:234 start_codon:yes stop_codon:yes gene_type:complete